MADLLLQAPIKYEPKTTNRWVMLFPPDIGIQSWALKSVTAPKPNISVKEMKFINTETYVATSFKWEAMTVTVRDFIAPSQAQAFMEWFRLHAESPTGRMGYAIGYAKDLELVTLDPTGVAIEKWLLEKCIIRDAGDFGTLDYNSDEVREFSFTIQPQRCILVY